MRFFYKAINKEGEIVEDVTSAEDKFVLAKQLRERGLSLIAAETKKTKGIKSFFNSLFSFGTVSTKEKILFGKNLASMIEAGLSLSRAISVMERQTKNKRLKFVLNSISQSIKEGGTLSSALNDNPKIFKKLFVAMVMAGEESGDLTGSLKVVSSQMEKSYELNKKIRGALIYPGVILFAMVTIGIFMLVYIVPTLTKTFAELDVDLPASTQFIINTSNAFQNNTVLLLSLVIAFIILLIFGMKTVKGKKILEKIFLIIPMVSTLVKETNSARTARTLSSLLSSGVPYLTAVEITKDVVQNHHYKKVLQKAEKNVELGLPIAKIFEENEKYYPIFVSEMIAIGEETGDLGGMLMKVAIYYENEVEQKTKNMSTIIEPFLMIVVGAAVGFFAISMISPMYSLVEKI